HPPDFISSPTRRSSDLRVDEGVRTALLKLRVLLLHVVLGAVIAKLHVARQRMHEFERARELVDKRGRQHPGRAQAAAEHDVVGSDRKSTRLNSSHEWIS